MIGLSFTDTTDSSIFYEKVSTREKLQKKPKKKKGRTKALMSFSQSINCLSFVKKQIKRTRVKWTRLKSACRPNLGKLLKENILSVNTF